MALVQRLAIVGVLAQPHLGPEPETDLDEPVRVGQRDAPQTAIAVTCDEVAVGRDRQAAPRALLGLGHGADCLSDEASGHDERFVGEGADTDQCEHQAQAGHCGVGIQYRRGLRLPQSESRRQIDACPSILPPAQNAR